MILLAINIVIPGRRAAASPNDNKNRKETEAC
jgi:hypothetical protein